MRIRDNVDKLPCLQSARAGKHHQKNAVLHDIPVACRQHILAALVQYAVEGVPRNVKSHRVRAGIQVHIFQICNVVHMRKDPAAGGIVFQIVQNLVYLIELPFRELIFYAQLVAVCLADAARFIRPAVPDMRRKIVDVIALFLPDPEDLVDGRFEVGAAYGKNGKFFPQIIARHLPEFFDGMRGCSVLPARAHLPVRIPRAVFEDVPAV